VSEESKGRREPTSCIERVDLSELAQLVEVESVVVPTMKMWTDVPPMLMRLLNAP
jgi:hypothetical protein